MTKLEWKTKTMEQKLMYVYNLGIKSTYSKTKAERCEKDFNAIMQYENKSSLSGLHKKR